MKICFVTGGTGGHIYPALALADKMKELARTEADLIVKEAKDNASAIVHEALVSAQKTEQELDMLKKSYSVYKTKMESLIKGQLSLLEKSNIEE